MKKIKWLWFRIRRIPRSMRNIFLPHLRPIEPTRLVQILPADDWYAVFKRKTDNDLAYERLVCWALTDEEAMGRHPNDPARDTWIEGMFYGSIGSKLSLCSEYAPVYVADDEYAFYSYIHKEQLSEIV